MIDQTHKQPVLGISTYSPPRGSFWLAVLRLCLITVSSPTSQLCARLLEEDRVTVTTAAQTKPHSSRLSRFSPFCSSPSASSPHASEARHLETRAGGQVGPCCGCIWTGTNRNNTGSGSRECSIKHGMQRLLSAPEEPEGASVWIPHGVLSESPVDVRRQSGGGIQGLMAGEILQHSSAGRGNRTRTALGTSNLQRQGIKGQQSKHGRK